MLDARIYRTGLVVVALAVIVIAFSLSDQQTPLSMTLAPDAFNGQNAYATMTKLAAQYPDRRPGSLGDRAVAGVVAGQLRGDGFTVSTHTSTAPTVDGARRLQTVVGALAGVSDAGSVVIDAPRDALRRPSTAALSGTGVLLELARDLSGGTQNRSIVLASTSGSAGGAGAAELARMVPGPIDAVIVLGDLAGSQVQQPIVVPWSNRQFVAPTVLRNTMASALASQTGLSAGGTSLGGQFLHLALPLASSDQAAFEADREPSVLLSLSSDRAPPAGEATSSDQITALGRTVLQTVSALSGGPQVAPPATYLLYSGKVVPVWAIRLLVLALMLPVLAATIDGIARARRRGHPIGRWLIWVLSAAAPFALAAIAVVVLGALGLVSGAVPGPVSADAGVLAFHGSSIAILSFLACLVLTAFVKLRPLLIRAVGPSGGLDDVDGPGAAVALLVVLCALAIAIWLANPFAAALIVPALHLWMWAVAAEVRTPRPVTAVLVLGGLVLPAVAMTYYAHALGLDVPGTAWSTVLLLAGGTVGLATALECSLLLGCVISLVLIALRSARDAQREEMPTTVRGPVSYAGPGSLGGTGSALRR